MPTSQETLSSKATKHKHLIPILICLALAILTVITFWTLKDCDFINLDDHAYVYENAYVQSGLNWNSIRQAFSSELVEKSGFWHPVTWLSLMLNYQIFGLNPHGYHLINLLFHIINTMLLFLIFFRMTKALWQSTFIAALFAIHPLHVESVAWIAERKDVLSTFFWMLTMGAYSYYVEYPGFRRYFLVLLFFVLGLMAKPMLITLPFVLLLLDYWPLQRFQKIRSDHKIQTEVCKSVSSDKQKEEPENQHDVNGLLEAKKPADPEYKGALIYPLLWEKVPLFVLAILSSIVTYITIQKVGGIRSIKEFPLSVRIGNTFISYITYIGKMIWPSNLAVFYPHPGSWPLWQALGSASLLIVITLAVIWMVRKLPYLAMGWFWYTGTLIPVIGLLQSGEQARADRYTYIPLIGLFIMVAWGVPRLLKQWRYPKVAVSTLSALVILCLSIITWIQVGYWQNSITIFEHTLKVNKNNKLAYSNLGIAYGTIGNYDQAIEDFNKAIEIDPKYVMAYYNRGVAYDKFGNYRHAISDFDRTIEIRPKYAIAYYSRGIVYDKLGNHDQAIEDLNKVIEIEPIITEAYYDRGVIYGKLGNYRHAISDFDTIIEINPKHVMAYYNRGVAYDKLGNYKRAIEDLIIAARLGHKNAQNYLICHGIYW